jgi:hypothetical protein
VIHGRPTVADAHDVLQVASARAEAVADLLEGVALSLA